MKSLIVGNLSFQTTEADLRMLFQQFGQVRQVRIRRDTGKVRGFAFVEMQNDEEAKKAMAALDGKEIEGRRLKVNEVQKNRAVLRAAMRGAGKLARFLLYQSKG